MNAGSSSSATTLDPSRDQENNQPSVDTDFDSYWEEEARNPHRNRIRIGRQYQATVPPLLKPGEKDARKLEDLETLTFCPKKSSRVSDAELDHYFTVAKSLNLFASLVETRSLLGRDVTIADLNHIRHKEGLSLASVIQPTRQATTNHGYTNLSSTSPLATSSQSSNNPSNVTTSTSQAQQSPQKSPPSNCEKFLSTSSSPKDQTNVSNCTINQPLMKALSHFISLHHPCHHDSSCKKLLKDIPLDVDSRPTVSITAGNLRQGSSSSSIKESKPGRSRSSLKNHGSSQVAKDELALTAVANTTDKDQDESQQAGSDSAQSPTFDDWTREEVELFSKAIEVCGKNFSSIKKEFLPSKSVKSIVEYYYIGSRDASENRKKASQPSGEAGESCSSLEKTSVNSQSGVGNSGCSSTNVTKNDNNLNSTSSASTVAPASTSRTTTQSSSSSSTTSTPTTTSVNNKSDLNCQTKQVKTSHSNSISVKLEPNSKLSKSESNINQDLNGLKLKASIKNVDPRLSVYNFDEELRDDLSPVRFECPRPGAEVKPLKAKPIIPNSSLDSDPSNSNVGSLKFFMDGELVLKLNACQEQQEGIEKCHWVQSGDKVSNSNKQKRYTKRAADKLTDPTLNQNGSHSNSVISSYQDDDSTKNDDLSGDEDSKESMNSFTNPPQQQKNNLSSPAPKRHKIKNEASLQLQHHQQQQQQQQLQQHQQQQQQQLHHHLQQQHHQQLQQMQHHQQQLQAKLPQPINYNRMALNNRMKERVSDTMSPNPMITQAMPWLQANSFAVAAALLGGLPFPQAAQAAAVATSNSSTSLNQVVSNNNLSSKPMDLSLEHAVSKPLPKTSSRSSRSRPKNNN